MVRLTTVHSLLNIKHIKQDKANKLIFHTQMTIIMTTEIKCWYIFTHKTKIVTVNQVRTVSLPYYQRLPVNGP